MTALSLLELVRVTQDTDAGAKRLWTTQQMPFADLFSGRRGLSKPPIDDIETY